VPVASALWTWLPRLGLKARQPGYVDAFLAESSQDHECEGERERAAINAVDKDSVADMHTKGLQPPGKLLVGDVLRFAKFFDERLGTSLVEVTRLYWHGCASFLMHES